MIQDALIEVQDDLASRIALRHASQLEKSIPFLLQTLHVPDPEKYGDSPGDGWVKKKWEEVVVQKCEDNLVRMIKKEFPYCYSNLDPIIVPGERDKAIFSELNRRAYGFFIEGLVHAFEPDQFYEKLDTWLYRNLPCPALLVKNLVPTDAGTLVIGTPEKTPLELEWLPSLLGKLPGKLDILECHFETQVNGGGMIEIDPVFNQKIFSDTLKPAEASGRIRAGKGLPMVMAGLVRDYAMVVSFVPDSKDPMAQLLAMCPGPIFFCPEP